MLETNKNLFSSPLMENWVPKSESSPASLSSLESIGDSETDLGIDINMVSDADMVSDEFASDITNSDYDDDAESTSGENSCLTDENVRHDTRLKMLCKNWWYDLYDVKHSVNGHTEIIEEQIGLVGHVVQEEAVVAQDDAEINRLFWDACIAHGF